MEIDLENDYIMRLVFIKKALTKINLLYPSVENPNSFKQISLMFSEVIKQVSILQYLLMNEYNNGLVLFYVTSLLHCCKKNLIRSTSHYDLLDNGDVEFVSVPLEKEIREFGSTITIAITNVNLSISNLVIDKKSEVLELNVLRENIKNIVGEN